MFYCFYLGIKYKQFSSVIQHIQNSSCVAILNHGIEVIFASISGVFDRNEILIDFIDGQTVAFDSDILIIKKKGKSHRISFL